MAQQPNPQFSQSSPTLGKSASVPSQSKTNRPVALKTPIGKNTQKLLDNIWEPLDQMGKALMGELWRTVYLSIKDAIALGLLVQIPGLIGQWITGKNFSSFSACLLENAFSPTRYACFVIVGADFLLWIVLAGRILGRFWADIKDLRKGKRGCGHGTK